MTAITHGGPRAGRSSGFMSTPSDPNPMIEARGTILLALLEALKALGWANEAARLFLEARLREPLHRDHWYPLDLCLDCLADARDRFGEQGLRAVGRLIPAMAVFPPEVRTLDRALRTLDIAYHLNHRGGEVGNYLHQSLGVGQSLLHCSNPYGCAFDLGILEGLSRRFLPPGTPVEISHQHARTCRDLGAESCIYRLNW